MQLKPGTLLQGGKYKIVRFIKSGGFGCTYEALHSVFGIRVALKEFFPKDFCNRDADTLHVTVGTQSKAALVAKLKAKFIDEAVAIHNLSHVGIVKVSDVFEENGTAYYVMDYIDGCSLDEIVKREGALSEQAALGYIRQVCSALDYVHSRSRLHLDIKPGNIMVDRSGHAILIDFGTSKQYDEVNGENTSTLLGMTPGYAPLEQNKHGGVSKFTPATDVYSVGATLYKLLTGLTPPDADEVNEDGLPPLPSSVSSSTRVAVEAAMSPRRKDRPQSIEAFLELLDAGVEPVDTESEETTLVQDVKPEVSEKPVLSESNDGHVVKHGLKWVWALAAGLIVAVVALLLLFPSDPDPLPLESVGHSDGIQDVQSIVESETSYTNGILRVKGVEYPMVYVSGGSFDMGATSEQGSDAYYDEKPVHRVTLSSYSIGKYEVTQELWEAVMGSNPSGFKGLRRPVEQVSWDDCKDFIRRLNELTGAAFRLPTEAEWEFAARGGNNSRGYKYSGSDTLDEVAWYAKNSGYKTHDVGTKSPNELGLYDMSGNVLEWCNDWYGSSSSSSQTNPKGSSSGSYRVYRGGSCKYDARNCRVSVRNYFTPDRRYNSMGLRLCH